MLATSLGAQATGSSQRNVVGPKADELVHASPRMDLTRGPEQVQRPVLSLEGTVGSQVPSALGSSMMWRLCEGQ